MYESDWNRGTISCCSICRKAITCKPNRIYGSYPKDKLVYEILLPNVQGKKLPRPIPPVATNTTATLSFDDYDDDEEEEEEDNEELIEFYEGRIADLERQLSEVSRVETLFRSVESELRRKSAEIYVVRREIDDRNMKIEFLIKENLEQKKEIEKINLNFKAATEELDEFKHFKMSSEIIRLANHISPMQKEAYFNSLLNDLSSSRKDLVMMIIGFEKKNAEGEIEKTELLKENRRLRIEKENLEKKMKLIEQQLKQLQKQKICPILKPKPKVTTSHCDDAIEAASETELDEPAADDENKENLPEIKTITNPFAIKLKASQNNMATSKMVPKTIPKGLSIPKTLSNSVSTGTGKRQKVLQLSNGKIVPI
jgi:septal ring factor EnvC (AmiA/AmiB activator)